MRKTFIVAGFCLATAFANTCPAQEKPARNSSPNSAATTAEARAFITDAESRLYEANVKQQRADWVAQNFITEDSEAISADANQELTALQVELAKKAHRFDGLKLSEVDGRKLKLIELQIGFPSPNNLPEQKELAQVLASLQADYGRGKWCPGGDGGKCMDITAVERLLATSRDPEEMKRAWIGWHAVGAPMRDRYRRMVELGNKGAKELGYSDVGAIWRSQYDMAPDALAAETDRLWEQLRPLYLSLHAYVRGQLQKKYGQDVVPSKGPIPAYLLGNIWSQEWNNVYDLMDSPKPAKSYDLTKILQERKT
ncbi:MAG TPA: M2 family metallopeptidase, partial [Candidatus Saccharimonadales bacterium]|nr:M2 family metallopeptidase [Candidatus Saccharimonadales bacterium]